MEIRSRSLTQSIVEDLGLEIVRGAYTPDNPFPIEAELCKRYAVSRSVLREAVKMLTSKGLLAARPRQGTKVQPEAQWNLLDPSVLRWLLERKLSLDLLAEFTEVRIAIEPEAAAIAAARATAPQLQAIESAIERMASAERGEDDALTSDIAFHVAVLDASGNRFFQQLKEFIETALRISIRLTNQFKGVRLASVEDHAAVMKAILAGDSTGASSAMRAMLNEALQLIRATQAAKSASAAPREPSERET